MANDQIRRDPRLTAEGQARSEMLRDSMRFLAPYRGMGGKVWVRPMGETPQRGPIERKR